jgi:hypothetical protein
MSGLKKISKSFQRLQKKVFGQKRIPAILGDANGNIDAGDGLVYATLRNGQTITVVNSKVPKKPMKVWLGFDENNQARMQVLSERFVFGKLLTSAMSVFDAKKFTWPEEYTIFVSGNQIIPLLAVPGSTPFAVKMYGATILWLDRTTYVTINPPELDLASIVPTDGSIYALLQVDNTGALSYLAGSLVAAPELMSIADIPVPDADHLEIWAVRLYAGQDRLHKDGQVNDFVDLRFGRGGGGGGGAGDMLASIYDPQAIAADAFDTDNHTDGTTNGVYTLAERSKLAGIAAGAEVNVNADWSAISGDAQILNKPTIPTAPPATTAANDFQVGDGAGAWIKKTLAEVKTILGLGSFAYISSLLHSALGSIGTDDHHAKSHVHLSDGSGIVAYSSLSGLPTITNPPATTALNDFQVGNGAGAWIKKTLAEIKTILGLGTAAYTASSDYAIAAKGVTNGDTHNHVGGDGAVLYSMLMMPCHGLLGTIAAGGTTYGNPFYYGLGNATGFVVSRAGALKNLYFKTYDTQSATGSLTATVRLSSSGLTVLVVTVAAGAVAGTYSDTVHTVAVSAGEGIYIEIKNNATATSTRIGPMSFELEVATT